ncbi:uncharacterized protein EI90DRAFT_3068796, partial [Cantharellus anzutake]|uniref:uncharacterized protein n=1 Tax=Cantharellus anzutake TaxID=1750568 RepID=UPI0019046A27
MFPLRFPIGLTGGSTIMEQAESATQFIQDLQVSGLRILRHVSHLGRRFTSKCAGAPHTCAKVGSGERPTLQVKGYVVYAQSRIREVYKYC